MTQFVYKIISKDLWHAFEKDGSFVGAPVDLADGFIHLSSKLQVAETAKRHFTGQDDLLLLALDADLLGPFLKWEPSRNNDLFPHLYRALDISDILWAKSLPLGSDGTHQFSGLLS
jgi:uncharacterized protein (DUF952 family)